MNLKMYRLLNDILRHSILDQPIRAVAVILVMIAISVPIPVPIPPTGGGVHRRLRPEDIIHIIIPVPAEARGVGREKVRVHGTRVAVFVDGEGFEVGLEFDDETAQRGDGGCDDAEVHHGSENRQREGLALVLFPLCLMRSHLHVPDAEVDCGP